MSVYETSYLDDRHGFHTFQRCFYVACLVSDPMSEPM